MNLQLDKYYCYYCEREIFMHISYKSKGTLFTKDHIIPRIKGGRNAQINLVDCCHVCNSFKDDLMPREFLAKVKKHIEADEKHKSLSIHLLQKVYCNMEILIKNVVEVHGKKLYTPHLRVQKINPPKYLKHIAADAHLSVNTNY